VRLARGVLDEPCFSVLMSVTGSLRRREVLGMLESSVKTNERAQDQSRDTDKLVIDVTA